MAQQPEVDECGTPDSKHPDQGEAGQVRANTTWGVSAAPPGRRKAPRMCVGKGGARMVPEKFIEEEPAVVFQAALWIGEQPWLLPLEAPLLEDEIKGVREKGQAVIVVGIDDDGCTDADSGCFPRPYRDRSARTVCGGNAPSSKRAAIPSLRIS